LVVSHSGLVPDLLISIELVGDWHATAGLNYVKYNKRCKLGLRQADFFALFILYFRLYFTKVKNFTFP